MSDIIIQVSLNGIRSRDVSNAVPWTPEEIAAEAKRCEDVGANVVHFHGREPDGSASYDPAWYAEADRLVRERTGLVVNHTTGRTSDIPLEAVLRTITDTPDPVDMMSLNVGHIMLAVPSPTGKRVTINIPNSYEDMVKTIEACQARGIVIEPAMLDAGYISNLAMLIEDGVMAQPKSIMVEFSAGIHSGVQMFPPSMRAFNYMRDTVHEHFPDAVILTHGMEESMFEIAGHAIGSGDHVRIGFEDTATMPDGSPARSNADFVEHVMAMCRAHGRKPASPAETRRLLGLAK